MRDGLKKRIQGNGPKTLSMVTTDYLSRNSHNNRVSTINCYSNNCGQPLKDASGNSVGTRQSARLNLRKYYAPFRQPIKGWRKSVNCVDPASVSNRNCVRYTEVYKDTYSNCIDNACETNNFGTLPTTKTPSNQNGGWGHVKSSSGVNARSSRPIIRSGMQPNSAGQQNSGKPHELVNNQKRYSYSYRELMNNRRKSTYLKKLATQKPVDQQYISTAPQMPGYGGNCEQTNNCNPSQNVYRLNNNNFRVHGAVESSTRLERLKLNAIRGSSKCISGTQSGPANARSNCNGVYFAGKPRNPMGPSGQSYTQRKYKFLFNQNKSETNYPQTSALARVRGAVTKKRPDNNTTCCNN